jgi:hypothetical protein
MLVAPPAVSVTPKFVMPGLDPGIHPKTTKSLKKMDGRVKPGHDE